MRICRIAFISRGVVGAWIFVVVVAGAALGLPAQDGGPSKPNNSSKTSEVDKTQSDVSKDLLDLLNEPIPKEIAKDKSGSGTSTQPKPTTGEANGQPSAGKVDADHPLGEVHLGMITAADWLRSRSPLAKTKGLQNDIVARLDTLIQELESAPREPNQSGSTQRSNEESPKRSGQSSAATNPDGQQSRSGRSRSGDQSSSDEGRDPKGAASNRAAQGAEPGVGSQGDNAAEPDGPPGAGQLKQRGTAVVDLRDPQALQRSAWGNLPERVREQMQSRMVERFLPSYREDIEAYYRALSK